MGNKVSRTSAPPSTLSYKIRNYKVVRDLGTGGFAKVVLASDDDTNLVAIKILYSAAVDQWQNFENEFKIQKSLKHEGVVECYESFVDESAKGSRQYCIVQEFCANGDLAGHISTAIPIDLMMKWFIFLLETLAFIHSRGIIHRDIKPENILLTAEMRVKLSDFGIATGKDEAGTKIGTERFVAPEVISEKTYTSKVDIWSLGCVLYQCIIGDKDNFKFREAARADFPLVQDESIKEILRKMLTDAPRRLSAEELLRDPCIIGWKIALAMPLTDAQKTYAASSNVLAPMLSILMAGSVPGRLHVMETLNRAKLLQIKDVRSVLVNSGALVSLITSAGESSADIERVIKCLDSFEGAELRAAKCLELFLDYLYKRKTALLVPLLTRIAKQDPGSRALISDDVRTFDLCKSLILTYPEMTVMIRDPTHLTPLIDKLRGKQSEINIAVKEYFASHTLSPTRRSELMKLALNADMFSVLFHNLFDWNTMINSALKKMICLDDLTENVRSEHEAFSCHSCSLNQTLDALCIVCAIHSHAQHDIEGKPGASQSRGHCAGVRANSQQLNHPLRNMSIPSPQKPPLETGYSNPSASTIHIENDSIKGTVVHPTSLQSSVAIVKTAECFYFEVTAKTTGYTDSMSIGISRLHYSPEMFPGWGPLSIGYQSDGKIYTGDQAKGKSFGLRYRAGDVIGCGVHPNGSVFFTLNGIFIGFCDNFNAIARANVTYYPAIGVQNGPFELDVNFGTKPFLFSFKFTDELSSIDKWPTRADVMSELDFNLAKVTLVTKLTRATHRQTITHIILCINALVKKDPETSKFIAQTINEKHLLQYISDHQADTPLNCRIVKEWFDLSGRNPSPVRDPLGQLPVEPVNQGKKNSSPLLDRPIRPSPFDSNRKIPVSNTYTSVLTAPEQAQLIEQKRSQTGILKQKPESPNITLFLIREGRKGKDVITLPKQGLTMAVLKEAVAEEMEISVADIDVLLYLMPVEHQDKKEEVRLTDKKLPLVLDLSTIEVALKK